MDDPCAGSTFASIRVILAADAVAVGAAVANEVMVRPTPFVPHDKERRLGNPFVPWPVAPEWQGHGTFLPQKMDARTTFNCCLVSQELCPSLGLRPMRAGDSFRTTRKPVKGLFVTLANGVTSHISARELPNSSGGGRSFDVSVSSESFLAAMQAADGATDEELPGRQVSCPQSPECPSGPAQRCGKYSRSHLNATGYVYTQLGVEEWQNYPNSYAASGSPGQGDAMTVNDLLKHKSNGDDVMDLLSKGYILPSADLLRRGYILPSESEKQRNTNNATQPAEFPERCQRGAKYRRIPASRALECRLRVRSVEIPNSDLPHTELVREILCGSAFVEAASADESQFQSHAVTECLMHIMRMLEMEARAWAESHAFSLLEVWRGIRTPMPTFFNSVLGTTKAYTLGPGDAGTSRGEKNLASLVDWQLAEKLLENMPRRPPRNAGDHALQFAEGNIDVMGFAKVLDRICRRAELDADIFRFFVDLGSGRGLAVLTAHLLFPFRRCIGVEVVAERVESSKELASAQGVTAKLFVQGDFLSDFDWSGASLVLCNAVTWPLKLIQKIAMQALRLRRGAVFLLASRNFQPDPELLQAFDMRGEACQMSFASDVVHFVAYQRL